MNAGKWISILLILVNLGNFFAPTKVAFDDHADHPQQKTNPQAIFQPPRSSFSAASTPSDGGLNISEEWRIGQYGFGIGASGLFVGDIDADGKLEVVAGATSSGDYAPNEYWYVLRQNGSNNYTQVWVSNQYLYPTSITRIAVADANQDGTDEIYVGLYDQSLHVYRGTDFQEIGSFKVECAINSLVIADTNNNGSSEILISDQVKIAAYNSTSFGLLWETNAYGGQLAVGNVDNDLATEIISSSGYVLNGATRDIEWQYTGDNGFGPHLNVGDIDGDGIDEIVGDTNWQTITVFEADHHTASWTKSDYHTIYALKLGDVDNDGLPEILVGDGLYLHCIDGQTRNEDWNLRNLPGDFTNIALGDVNSDGVLDVIWGAGYSSSGPDYIIFARADTHEIEWQSDDLDGSFSAVDVGDVDDDGEQEIVMATDTSDNRYSDGNILCIDGKTHQIEWQIKDLPNILTWSGINSLRIGDVDGDGRTEFVIATSHLYGGLIQIYDGKTHSLERQSEPFYESSLTALEIGDVDGDGQTEIVAGELSEPSTPTGGHVIVFDGATAAQEWKSSGLDASSNNLYDIDLVDIDGDGQIEIIAITGTKLYVFDGATHLLKSMLPVAAHAVSSADLDHNGDTSILVGLDDGHVALYNGKTYQLETTISFGAGPITCLSLADVDLNGIPEWLVCESNRLSIYSSGTNDLLWRSNDLGGSPGENNQIVASQMDAFSDIEIIVGSMSALYQFKCEYRGPLAASSMNASSKKANPGDSVTFGISLSNNGTEDIPIALLLNHLPRELSYVPDSLSVSSGNGIYENGSIVWSGPLTTGAKVLITYEAAVGKKVNRNTSVLNAAKIQAGQYAFTLSVEIQIPLLYTYLPLCSRYSTSCELFFDDFQNASSGWPIGEDAYMRTEYTGGEYRLLGKKTGYIYLVKAPTCKRVNYVVEVDARWTGITGDNLGLIFGLNDNFTEYYLLTVNTDYKRMALYYRGPSGSTSLIGMGFSDSIHTGFNSNHLKVTRSGSQIIVEINGVNQGIWDHAAVKVASNVGIFNAPYSNTPNSDARFDNFKVTLIPMPPTLTSGEPDTTVVPTQVTSPQVSAQPFKPLR